MRRKRIRNLVLYGSHEALLIGIRCERCDTYHVVDRSLQLGVDEGNGYKAQGLGKLIITKSSDNFPFIRYSNGDNAMVHHGLSGCGFGGTRVLPLGRTFEVKVPDMADAPVNWGRVYESFTRDFGPDVLFLYGRLFEDTTHFILATFIGSGAIDRPRLDVDLSARVATEGLGFSVEYVKFLPVVWIPSAMARVFDGRTLNKRKTLVSCIGGGTSRMQ